MENKTFEITFNFLYNKHIGYFEIAPLDDICYVETKTKTVNAENLEKACNIIKCTFGKTVNIEKTREIKNEKEMNFER